MSPSKTTTKVKLPPNPFIHEILELASKQRSKAKKIEILKEYEKNRKRNQKGETEGGEDTGGEVEGTPDGPGGETTEKNPFYGDMKPKEFYEMLEGMGQRGANRAFFKEGARAFANAPLVSIPVMQQMLQETGGVTRQQMASFGNMVNSTAFSPTRQKIAGKYFNL